MENQTFINSQNLQNPQNKKGWIVWVVLVMVILLIAVLFTLFGGTNSMKNLSVEEKEQIIEDLMKRSDGNKFTAEEKEEYIQDLLDEKSMVMSREEKEKMLNSLLNK